MSAPRCFECGHILDDINAWCPQCCPQGNIPGTVDHAQRLWGLATARAEAAEARCKRLEVALRKAREVRKKLVYFKDDFCRFEDGKRAWRLLEEMQAALSDTAQQETGDE